MGESFFDFDSIDGLWRKTLRELEVLRRDVSTDTIFNFFVTAYHVMDHVWERSLCTQAAKEEMYRDRTFRLCRFICNKGKHLVLDNPLPGHDTHSDVGALIRYAVVVVDDGTRLDVLDLANDVVARWRRFFQGERYYRRRVSRNITDERRPPPKVGAARGG
jgi:hypothetical protein